VIRVDNRARVTYAAATPAMRKVSVPQRSPSIKNGSRAIIMAVSQPWRAKERARFAADFAVAAKES
jgi:hypothetical protein